MPTPTTPAAAPTAEIPAITFRQLLILLVIGLGGLFLLAGVIVGGVYWSVNSGGADRPAIVSADDAAEQSMRAYAASLADIYAMAAEGIERGDIESDVELFDYAKPQVDSAREQAFSAIDESAETSIPGGEWSGRDIDEAREFCELAAEGFRRLAE